MADNTLNNINSFFKLWSNRWYTRLIPAQIDKLMELERNAEFMRGLGFAFSTIKMPVFPKLSNFVSDNTLEEKPYVVIAPTASWRGREWPLSNFIEVGKRIVNYGYKVVVIGEINDEERLADLVDNLNINAINLIGKTTLPDLVEILRKASVVVANESAPLHIAASLDKNIVSIVGGGHFGRFVPYQFSATSKINKLPLVIFEKMDCFGCNWKCIYERKSKEPVKCIKDISIDKVWNQVSGLLAKN
mgnify:CR=1 FL=1